MLFWAPGAPAPGITERVIESGSPVDLKLDWINASLEHDYETGPTRGGPKRNARDASPHARQDWQHGSTCRLRRCARRGRGLPRPAGKDRRNGCVEQQQIIYGG